MSEFMISSQKIKFIDVSAACCSNEIDLIKIRYTLADLDKF